MKKKLDIYSFLTDVPEEPKPEPIKEEVVETPVEPESAEPVEYKFKFREVVKEEKKVKKRNVFEFLVGKPAEESVQEKFSQSDVDGLEKFADRILKKYDIDVEFTRHFVDRLNDPRNDPEIKVAELQRFFKKIQKNKGKDIRQNPDVEVVLKDLASNINLPVVINYKDGEFEVVNKTVMRKKDFKTPDKVIKYEEIEEEPRVPRKKGQPAKSDKHSDLYTDEDPVGTIHGLGFKDVETAKASVKKIDNSDRTHAHKVQAAVAMEQRAKEMGKTSEAAVYRKYIEKMKKITKQKQKKEDIEENVISKSVEYLHNNKEEIVEIVEKTEYDLIREELNTLKKTIATSFGKMDYGSGEVRLEFLDDIDRDSAKVNNKFLRYNSSTGKWQGADASGSGGGISWQAVKTSDFNADAGEGYFINTTSGTVTATLPASPSLGDEIAFVDYAGTADTNAITIDRNGKPINSATENLNVATERAAFTLVFTDNTQGWVLKEK
ncbi:MAG: hypothetical protein VW270_13045 [Candidatus Poseidoniales archaeon]